MPNPREEVERGDLVARLRSRAISMESSGITQASWINGPTPDLLREAAAALSRAEEEEKRLREYCAASAEDWAGTANQLREAGVDGILPKSIAEMMDTAAVMRRAACGEDIWPEYQSELFQWKERASRAEEERDGKKYSGPALERACQKVYEERAALPPGDPAKWSDASEEAREWVRGNVAAALLAFLDPEDEEMVEWVAKEHCGFHRDPQLNTDWRYHLRDAHGIVAALRAFLSRAHEGKDQP